MREVKYSPYCIYVKAGRMAHLAYPYSRYTLCGSHTNYGGHDGPMSAEDVEKRHLCRKCQRKADARTNG